MARPGIDMEEPRGPGSYVVADRTLRILSADIISFMSEFPSEVIPQAVGNYTLRSLRIDCTAPLEHPLQLYLNGAQHKMSEVEISDVVVKEPTVIDIGDVVSGERVVNRWARLSRKNEEPFGVSGVSRTMPDGTLERWNALTATIAPTGVAPRAWLWGEPESDGGPAALIPTGPGRSFMPHFFALRRGIGRSLEKRTSPTP